MVAHLDTLIAMIPDEKLKSEIQTQVSKLAAKTNFGLVFEEHRPEMVQLPGFEVTRGGKVVYRDDAAKGVWTVLRLVDRTATIVKVGDSGQRATANVEELVVVREFGDPIYPGLESTGKIERGGSKPFHSVINAENFHALQALLYTHHRKVDAIYIDPPYNTGAKDWKYNNDYVDGEDAYRHSKWLAFMERRLKLAKKLLNPADSVLIVTIDEKEYLRLGLLLEQTFPEARIQMVSSVINPAGSTRPGGFARTDEYVFFVLLGKARPRAFALSDDWRLNPADKRTTTMLWSMLKRTGTGNRRDDRPAMFYPIFVSSDGQRIVEVGASLSLGVDRHSVTAPPGTVACFPINADGSEGRWQIGQDNLRQLMAEGFVRLGRSNGNGFTVSYLKAGEQRKVRDGIYEITGRRTDGSVISDTSIQEFVPGTAWRVPSHDSSRHGSNLLRALMPDRKFPFPKSLYAIEDALRFFVKDKPDATVLDFFAGSGTTTHAVMRLNRQDGGRRRSIAITNNEVSAEEQGRLERSGLLPGDDAWEALGICEYITKPRLRAAATGIATNDQPIKGDYRFVDEFPMSEGFEENVEFFKLTYEDNQLVRLGRKFHAIAPLLWMRAGAEGRRIDELPDDGWALSKDSFYGVLTDIDQWEPFVDAVNARDDVRCVFIVTDSQAEFEAINVQIDQGIDSVRLYSDYLQSFEINTRQG
jgi:adenine-specific DNA-methyltransferase